ncbi:hypothetical protein AAMO2058_000584700 [Amorphochlora amoebiformis]
MSNLLRMGGFFLLFLPSCSVSPGLQSRIRVSRPMRGKAWLFTRDKPKIKSRIGEAVVTGLCKGTPELDVSVTISPRNAARAQRLAERYPQVEIGLDNQEVLDRSDIICIAVTPDRVEKILSELTFRPDQKIVSFISTTTLQELRALCSPASEVFRAIPMPPIAKRAGPLPVCPEDSEGSIVGLFEPLGEIISVEQEDQLKILMSCASIMATYYELINVISKWLYSEGLPQKIAMRYTGALFDSLARDTIEASFVESEDMFDTLVAESQTPGGLNEQSLRKLKGNGWFTQVTETLQKVLQRVRGTAANEYGSDESTAV